MQRGAVVPNDEVTGPRRLSGEIAMPPGDPGKAELKHAELTSHGALLPRCHGLIAKYRPRVAIQGGVPD